MSTRGELGETTCLGVEFDYDLCDRAPVEIRIRQARQAR